MLHQERNAEFMAGIQCDIDGILTWLVEFQLLDVDDEISDEEIRIGRNDNIDRHVDAGHDKTAILIHEVHFDLVLAFLDSAEGHAEDDGALRVNGRELVGDNRIECPEQI